MRLKNLFKKLTGCVLCGALIVGTMGMTSLAAIGSISGSCSNNYATAKLVNLAGSTRYCNVSIKQSDSNQFSETISANGGNVSSGNSISASGTMTKIHARGFGTIYNSSAPQSGVAWSGYTDIR